MGAFLGVVIGGFIGGSVTTSTPHRKIEVESKARNIREGTAEVVNTLALGVAEANAAFSAWVIGILFGAGIGGVIGAVGGSVTGAGLAAKSSKMRAQELPPVRDTTTADWRHNPPVPLRTREPSTEITDPELARLKDPVAEHKQNPEKDSNF
jgi:hypothetical protein